MATYGVDTSVAVPLLLRAHPDHAVVAGWAAGHDLALSGHAAFETYAVLTAMKPPFRTDARTASQLLSTGLLPALAPFPAAASPVFRIASLGITGGAIWDALVAIAAVDMGWTLASRDTRALPTYARVGATVEIVG